MKRASILFAKSLVRVQPNRIAALVVIRLFPWQRLIRLRGLMAMKMAEDIGITRVGQSAPIANQGLSELETHRVFEIH